MERGTGDWRILVGGNDGRRLLGDGQTPCAIRAPSVHRSGSAEDLRRGAAGVTNRVGQGHDDATRGRRLGLDDLPSAAAFDDKGVLAEAVPVIVDRTSGHSSVEVRPGADVACGWARRGRGDRARSLPKAPWAAGRVDDRRPWAVVAGVVRPNRGNDYGRYRSLIRA